MAIPTITSHVADAISRLMGAYQGQPLVVGLLSSLVQQVQELEDATPKLKDGLTLGNLQGQALDDYGTLLGVPRDGLDDDAYRSILGGTIGANFSDGSSPVLLDALALLFVSETVFRKDPNSPGLAGAQNAGRGVVAFGIGSPKLPPSQYALAVTTFQKAVPAGIGLYYLSTFDSAGAFAMAGPQSWVRGFGDANNPSVGGKMAGLLYSNAVL